MVVLTGKGGIGKVNTFSELIESDDQVCMKINPLQTKLFTCVHPVADNQQLLYQTKLVIVFLTPNSCSPTTRGIRFLFKCLCKFLTDFLK